MVWRVAKPVNRLHLGMMGGLILALLFIIAVIPGLFSLSPLSFGGILVLTVFILLIPSVIWLLNKALEGLSLLFHKASGGKYTCLLYTSSPTYAVLDPELIMTAPASVAAACGVDALILSLIHIFQTRGIRLCKLLIGQRLVNLRHHLPPQCCGGIAQVARQTFLPVIARPDRSSIIAVSYTHLDVYKRQPIHPWSLLHS